MTRALGIVTALLVIAAVTPGAVRPASAEGTWADLTYRIVSARERGPYKVIAGAVPAGFVFPPDLRPDLPLLGATCSTSTSTSRRHRAPRARSRRSSRA
jgi:hypothetical protein